MCSPSPAVTTGTVRYLKWLDLYNKERPFQVFIEIPKDASDQRTTNLEWEQRLEKFHDVRGREDSFTLDGNGFMYLHAPTEFHDFGSPEAVEAQYLPEIDDLLRSTVDGIDRIFFFDWRVSVPD